MFFSKLRALAVLAATAFVHASPLPENVSPVARQGLAQIVTSCTVPNTVALTFDDGPWIYLYDVVNTLNAAGARGTFFFNGFNYGCIYAPESMDRVRYAYYSGHQVASHTWAHRDLTTLSWDQIHDEMWRVELALMRIVGVSPAFMRPPYGAYNDQVRSASAIRGQSLVIWDFDSRDSLGASAGEINAAYDGLAAAHPSTILALNHETLEPTVHQVLPHAIAVLQGAGYQLVTLAECLGMPAYQSYGEPQGGEFSC